VIRESECVEWKQIYRARMLVTATRKLGSGELVFGIVLLDGEEFLVVEESKTSRNLLLLPVENIVVNPDDIIRNSAEYALYHNESGAFVGVYSPPAIDRSAVWE